MQLLVVAALVVGSFVTPKKPAPKLVETFDTQYMAQVDKTNAALRDYANTPCIELEFEEAQKNLEKEDTVLIGMYHSIPEGEDEIVQAKQVELYVGFLQLATGAADQQKTCIEHYKNQKLDLPEGI